MSIPPISTREQAEEFLRPFRPTLSGAIRGSFVDWADLLTNAPGQTAGLSVFLLRRFIHDRTVYHLSAAEVSGSCPGLRLRRVRGLWVAILHDQMVLKLKKLDFKRRSRNIATGQTQAFDTQGYLLPSEVGRVTNAASGYIPDPLSGGFADLVVVCWDGDTKLWELPLEEEGEAGGPGPIVTIPADTGPASGAAARRTKIIKPEEAKRESE